MSPKAIKKNKVEAGAEKGGGGAEVVKQGKKMHCAYKRSFQRKERKTYGRLQGGAQYKT